MKIKLKDGAWLEGKCEMPHISDTTGIWLKEAYAFVVDREGVMGTVPLAKEVFVPMSAILFIIVEE